MPYALVECAFIDSAKDIYVDAGAIVPNVLFSNLF